MTNVEKILYVISRIFLNATFWFMLGIAVAVFAVLPSYLLDFYEVQVLKTVLKQKYFDAGYDACNKDHIQIYSQMIEEERYEEKESD